MGKSSLVFELTDGEIRAFYFSAPPFRKSVHKSSEVKFDRIPIPTGIIEQGMVRNENSLIEILSKYRPQKTSNYHKVCLAIPLQQGFIGAYTLPWLPKRDRKSAIALLVDEEIAIARSDLIFDFLVVSEVQHQSLRVLLGAARRSILKKYAYIFDQAGFRVTDMDFAYAILGQALGFKADEDVLYLQEEIETLQAALFRGIVPESVRSLPSLQLQVESEEQVSKEWENEIGRFLLFHQTQQPNLYLKRILWSGNSGVERLAQRLSASNHNLTIERAMLRNIPDSWQQALESSQCFGAAAMGYGVQISTNCSRLNLWRQPTAEQKVRKTYFRTVLLAAGLLLLGNFLWLSICQRTLPLQQEVTTLSSQGAVIEKQNRSQEALAAAWNKVSLPSEGVGERLTQVQAISGTELKIEQVIFKQGSLALRGSAHDSEGVQKMIQALRDMGWENPGLSSYRLKANNTIEFVLNAK